MNGNVMTSFEQKYGIKEDENIKKFHRSRRMFCIIDDVLHIAQPNLSYSHAVWFEKEGWITTENDRLMETVVRGFIDFKGDIYFFVGYDFQVNDKIEKQFFNYLSQFVSKLKLDKNVKVYGGLIKQTYGGQWPGKKYYGMIKDLYR